MTTIAEFMSDEKLVREFAIYDTLSLRVKRWLQTETAINWFPSDIQYILDHGASEDQLFLHLNQYERNLTTRDYPGHPDT